MIIKTKIKSGNYSWFLRRLKQIKPGKRANRGPVYCADELSKLGVGIRNDSDEGEPTGDPDY